MAGRNHDTTVKIIHPGDVGHRRRGSDVQQVGICAGSGQACNQTILKHIGATASVLANYNTRRIRITVALTQSVVIPAQKTTNLIGMICGQSDSSFATEAVSSKILSHINLFPHPKSELTIICFSRKISSLPAIRHLEAAY